MSQEEEDDFYKTTYGGFAEEADDRDFNYQVRMSFSLFSKEPVS
jgi:hypothetical protein